VQLIQQTITKIDPGAKRVITDKGSYTTDYLVVALGADYDWWGAARIIETPG
jgi:NADH dehydrogenase FAD-containing subunit